MRFLVRLETLVLIDSLNHILSDPALHLHSVAAFLLLLGMLHDFVLENLFDEGMWIYLLRC